MGDNVTPEFPAQYGVQRNVPAGRVVGGGTAVNGMFFDRGSRRDYDEWAEYIGDASWGWDGLLKYFKKVSGGVVCVDWPMLTAWVVGNVHSAVRGAAEGVWH